MNRRRFIQSIAAVFTLPGSASLSLGSATATLPAAAAAVPKQARFWAIYMSGLHGECTPQTLQNLLHIPEIDAKNYVSRLIADGVLKPNPLLKSTVTNALKANDNNLLDKTKKRLEMKSQAKSAELEMSQSVEAPEDLLPETEEPETVSEHELEDNKEETLEPASTTDEPDEVEASGTEYAENSTPKETQA